MTLDELTSRAEARRATAKKAVWVVLLLGVVGFLIRGADRPADPQLLDAGGLTPIAGFSEVSFQVRTPEGDVLDWCALLAATEAARQQGLMGQRDLLGYDGMVFRFDEPTRGAFWMYRTLIPLSIAFFDQSGALVSTTDMEPCRSDDAGECPTHPAEGPFTHALEVPKGGLDELGVRPGSTISFVEGDCR